MQKMNQNEPKSTSLSNIIGEYKNENQSETDDEEFDDDLSTEIIINYPEWVNADDCDGSSAKTEINYPEWINNYDTNKKYYMLIDSYEFMIIPFKVIKIDHETKYDNIVDAIIYYKDNEYQVKITMSQFVELDDKYNISISFEIKSDEKIEEIYEFCYISEEKIEN